MRGKLISWATKGGLATIDQALISGSNFVIGILLGRWLSAAQYGSYATAFSIFLLLALLFNSLVLEPMTVFGASSYRNCLRGYLNSLCWMHAAIGGIVFCCLAVASAIARLLGQGDGLPGALLGVMFAAPCVLLFWLVRRTYYLNHSVARATAGSIVYCVLVLGGLFVVRSLGYVSSFSVFLLMAFGALVTASVQMMRLRRILSADELGPTLQETLHRHWGYGKWALAGAVMRWIPAFIYFPLLGAFGSMAQAGELKALLNLPAPIEQTYGALSMLLLPYAARQHAALGPSSAGGLNRKITLLCITGTLPFWLVVVPFKSTVFHYLYKGNFMEVTWLVPLVALSSILWSATYGPVVVLRAMESPASVFVAYSFSSAIAVLAGIPLTWSFGLLGAILSINCSNAAAYLVAAIYLRRRTGKSITAQTVTGVT